MGKNGIGPLVANLEARAGKAWDSAVDSLDRVSARYPGVASSYQDPETLSTPVKLGGKTYYVEPAALARVQYLQKKGYSVGFITRD